MLSGAFVYHKHLLLGRMDRIPCIEYIQVLYDNCINPINDRTLNLCGFQILKFLQRGQIADLIAVEPDFLQCAQPCYWSKI